jgi:hypothetical protein
VPIYVPLASSVATLELIACLKGVTLPRPESIGPRSQLMCIPPGLQTGHYAAMHNNNDLKFSPMVKMHANRACILVKFNDPFPSSSLENKRISPHLKAQAEPVAFATIP